MIVDECPNVLYICIAMHDNKVVSIKKRVYLCNEVPVKREGNLWTCLYWTES